MHQKHVFASLLIAVVALSSWAFSNFLESQDTTFRGYLSGMLLDVMGGDNTKLIRVNLFNRSMDMYENGILVRHAQIAGSGNPNDRTITPTGSFRILSKEPRHISRVGGGVIMPWAMRFYEGYYFHDIPLTPAGAVINTKYSHGCIRLPSALAPEAYQWATVGTYVEVYRSRLVKTPEAETVYLLTEDGFRQPIASLDAFYRNGFSFNDVAVIPWTDLAQLPLGATVE